MPWLHPTSTIAMPSCLEFITNAFTNSNSFTTLLPGSSRIPSQLLMSPCSFSSTGSLCHQILLLTVKALHNQASTHLTDPYRPTLLPDSCDPHQQVYFLFGTLISTPFVPGPGFTLLPGSGIFLFSIFPSPLITSPSFWHGLTHLGVRVSR
ncbi:hypothetical protein LDENG_00013730 [Lucifuga dentata]|nr:hypothetical protein LDENG_00013730 [Lucifuga dentata]